MWCMCGVCVCERECVGCVKHPAVMIIVIDYISKVTHTHTTMARPCICVHAFQNSYFIKSSTNWRPNYIPTGDCELYQALHIKKGSIEHTPTCSRQLEVIQIYHVANSGLNLCSPYQLQFIHPIICWLTSGIYPLPLTKNFIQEPSTANHASMYTNYIRTGKSYNVKHLSSVLH